jgi:NitT/TauT family transport system permease protein
MSMPDVPTVPAPRSRGASPWRARTRKVVLALVALFLFCAAWEGYKALGEATDGKVFGIELPARYADTSLPHTWDVVGTITDQELVGVEGNTVGWSILTAAWFSFRIAAGGFVLGVSIGLLLAIVMQRFKVAERGLLPYVIVSQTIPLVALSPLIVSWGGRLHPFGLDWQRWMSVVVIAAYLAFFPVAVGALRGLQSPKPHHEELMQSYAAGWWTTLTKLRFPAAVSYILPSLRLAAASAVVGTMVGEISIGSGSGVGRLLIDYAQRASSEPARVYAAMGGAALLGLFVAGLIGLFEVVVMRNRPSELA